MSLSHNCVSDSNRNSRSSTIDIVDNVLVNHESDLLKENISRKTSNESLVTEKPIRYSIYQDQSMSTDDISAKYGKIMFSLQYNIDEKTLEVTIKKAKYLLGQRVKGKNHFYVKLSLKKPSK